MLVLQETTLYTDTNRHPVTFIWGILVKLHTFCRFYAVLVIYLGGGESNSQKKISICVWKTFLKNGNK